MAELGAALNSIEPPVMAPLPRRIEDGSVEKEKAQLAFEREQTTPEALGCVQNLSCPLKGFG